VIYTVKSPLTKTSGHYTAQQLYAAFEPMIPADQREAARRLLDRIVVLCKALDLDEVIVAAIVWIETGAAGSGLPFRSEWWRNGYNAGNLGITGDPAQNAAAQKWSTPEAAADGLIAHVVAYAYGSGWRTVWDVDELGQPQTHDKRFDLVLREYGGARLNSLEALNGKWAWDVDGAYDRKLAERANKLESLMDDPPVDVPTTPEEPVEEEPPMAELQFGRVPMFTFTDRQAQMARKPEGVGWDNLGKRNPKFIALHRIWGNLWGTDGYFANPSVQALTDFGVGVAAEDGAANAGLILKWTDPLGYRSGWASGRVSAPYGDGKKIVDKYGVIAVNRDGVSLEISGFENTPIDDKAWRQIVHFCAWWADFMKIPWNSRINPATGINYLIWHQEFTIGTGKQCPFALVMGLTDKLYTDVAAFLKPYQTGSAGEPQPEQPTEPVPTPTYAEPKPIDALVPFADVDPNQTDAVIRTGGKDYVFVNDKVRAIRETRRRQTAEEDTLDIGPVIPKGTTFEVTWLFQAGDGQSYYLTPWHSRIRVADTERIADAA
jgi:hypothetical protein